MTRPAESLAGCPICHGRATLHLNGLYDDRYGFPGSFDVLRCERCGHRFVGAGFSAEELQRLYSDWYPRASLRFEDLPPLPRGWEARGWLERERQSAFGWVPPGVSVLDIGCGFGQTLAFHEARGCRAVGVEADAHAVAEARGQGLDVRLGLFAASDFPDERFDYVTLDQVLEHALDPVGFLTEVASILKPGGMAVVATPNAGGYGATLFRTRWINWHVPYHLNLFTKRSLGRAARAAGFEVRLLRTETASAWLRFQWFHLFSRPREGSPSPFWDSHRSTARVSDRAGRWATRLDGLGAFKLATRVTDRAGIGDNLLAILSKPARS